MEIVKDATFVKKNGDRIPFEEAMGNAEIIAFYFSAHWCPPCQTFTPILAEMYKELKEAGLPFEIVFVSSDESEEEMLGYMNEAHGDWSALEFNTPVTSDLKSKFDVSGIPTLIVVKSDGTLICEDGRGDVESKGAAAYQQWIN